MKYFKFAWGFFWGVLAWIPLIVVWILYMIAELRFVPFADAINDLGV